MNSANPNVKDDELDRKMPQLFRRRMVTPAGPNQRMMGFQNWWKYYSGPHRAASCNPEMRCGQALDKKSEEKRLTPKCMACNTERWGARAE